VSVIVPSVHSLKESQPAPLDVVTVKFHGTRPAVVPGRGGGGVNVTTSPLGKVQVDRSVLSVPISDDPGRQLSAAFETVLQQLPSLSR